MIVLYCVLFLPVLGKWGCVSRMVNLTFVWIGRTPFPKGSYIIPVCSIKVVQMELQRYHVQHLTLITFFRLSGNFTCLWYLRFLTVSNIIWIGKFCPPFLSPSLFCCSFFLFFSRLGVEERALCLLLSADFTLSLLSF